MYVIGLLALSLLITAVIVIGILFLMSGFAYWLTTFPSMKAAILRKFLKQPLESTNQDTTSDSSNEGREEGKQKHKPLVDCIYPLQSIQKPYPLPKARELGINDLASIGENVCTDSKENNETQHPKASIEGFSPRWTVHRFCGYVPFSISRHIRTIVNWLRRRVNQSGKEPTL